MGRLDVWEQECVGQAPEKVYGLFSGGHDSLCSTHIAATHPNFQAAVHINTGTGIPETTEFVRDLCEERGWPLVELHPDSKTYEELVLEKGFPHGPMSHNTMYFYLKQRQIRRLVRENKGAGKVGLVAGVRKKESSRRMKGDLSVPVRTEGSQVWLNPILEWDSTDKNDYMELHDLPRNPVVDLLHKSGECLCGAYARRGELAEIEMWYPDTAKKIKDLEARAKAAGHDDHLWATKSKISADQQEMDFDMPLCSDCELAS